MCECKRCGSCCSLFDVPLTSKECERLSHDYSDGIPVIRMGTISYNGSLVRVCVYFDNKLNECTIYEERPEVCRLFDCRGTMQDGARHFFGI